MPTERFAGASTGAPAGPPQPGAGRPSMPVTWGSQPPQRITHQMDLQGATPRERQAYQHTFGMRDYWSNLLGEPLESLDDIMYGGSMNVANTRGQIQAYQAALAETDVIAQPMKAFFIRQKLNELNYKLQRESEYLGSTARGMSAANPYSTDASKGLGITTESSAGGTAAYSTSPEGYSYFDTASDRPTAPRHSAYGAPAWMQGFLAPTGQTRAGGPYREGMGGDIDFGGVRPWGAQAQIDPIRQAQLGEMGVMRDVSNIEEYMQRQSYIAPFLQQQRAKSSKLIPKGFNRNVAWERARQI